MNLAPTKWLLIEPAEQDDFESPAVMSMSFQEIKGLHTGHKAELWMQQVNIPPKRICDEAIHVRLLCAISPTIAWQVADNGPDEFLERIALPSAPVAAYVSILAWALDTARAGHIAKVPILKPTPLFKYYSIARTASLLGIEPLVTSLNERFDSLIDPECMSLKDKNAYHVDFQEIVDAYKFSKPEYGLQEKLVDCIARAILSGLVGGYCAKLIGNAERLCKQFSRDLRARKEEIAPRRKL